MKIVWDLTYCCNLKCTYCGAEKIVSNGNFTRPWNEIVDEIVYNKINHVELLGGEPLMHPQFFNICVCLFEQGILFSIITNGQFPPSYAIKLMEKPPSAILISLDHLEFINDSLRGKGCFEKAISFSKEIFRSKIEKKLNTTVGVNCVLHKQNAGTITDFVTYLDEKTEFEFIQINEVIMEKDSPHANSTLLTVDELVNALENLAKTSMKLHKLEIFLNFQYPLIGEYLNFRYGTKFEIQAYSCDAVRETAFINPDGKFFPCRKYNIQSFKTIRQMLSVPKYEFLKIEKKYMNCDNCEYYEKCHSCPLEATLSKPEICIEIEHRYNSFIKEFYHIIFRINPQVDIASIGKLEYIVDRRNNSIIEELTKEGHVILSTLKTWKSPVEIAESNSLNVHEVTLFILDLVTRKIIVGGKDYEKIFE